MGRRNSPAFGKSALLAPEIYKDLLPVITPVLKMGMAL
jgi:hypothetical protein